MPFIIHLIYWFSKRDDGITPGSEIAFDAIIRRDLETLKKHPFWDESSPYRDPKAFRDMTDLCGQTMLVAATYAGDVSTVKFLVEEVKVDINQRSKNGEHPLHLACHF